MSGSGPIPPIRIVGCGRSLRRDDQIGLHLAEALASAVDRPPAQARITTTESPGADLIDDLDGVDLLVIVDAAQEQEGFPSGSWTRINWAPALGTEGQGQGAPDRARLVCRCSAAHCRTTTHTLGVDTALQLGHQLGVLPPDIWIYAVAGEDFGYGPGLSVPVERSIPRVVERIRGDLDEWLLDG